MAVPFSSNIFGYQGIPKTPQEIERQRRLALALRAQIMGGDNSPETIGEAIGNGLSGLGAALASRRIGSRADNAEKAGRASVNFGALFPGGSSAPSTQPPMTSATAPATASTTPVSVSGSNTPVYEGFISTVKQGGVTNPYALAAIASTGKAESAFSPGNANRTWDDGANNAGGIMSWNGPRLRNLMAFAQSKGESGLGSPQTQAEFFLQENPQLIAQLNNASSLAEAQTLMNNAWRFKGYDQPGGEAARRLEYARAYLPTFQSSTPAQNAIEAVAAPAGYHRMPDGSLMADAEMQPASLPMPEMAGQVAATNPATPPSPVQTASLSPTAGAGAALAPPPLSAPRNVSTPPTPPMQPATAQRPLMQALAQRFGGSQQLANANPNRGILTALLAGQGNAAPQSNQQAGFPPPPSQPSRAQTAASIMTNPWATDGERAVAAAVLKQEISGGQPIEVGNALVDPRTGQVLYQAPTKQDVPASVDEYNFYVQQEQAAGRQPLSYNDWQLQSKRAGATSVNVGNAKYGTIPQGYMLQETPQGARLVPIPGGPAATEAEQAQKAAAAAQESKSRSSSVVLEDIGRVREKVKNAPWYSPTVGLGSGILASIPGTGAADVVALTDTIKANIGFDRLQQMREESPTGGALGQVTERELNFLQSVLGSLSQSQSEEQFLENLGRLDRIYREISRKAGAYPNAAKYGFAPEAPSEDGGEWQDVGNGVRIRVKQ